MKAKSKAKKLVNWCWLNIYSEIPKKDAVRCAIMCVNEVISELKSREIKTKHWKKVKRELQKMNV